MHKPPPPTNPRAPPLPLTCPVVLSQARQGAFTGRPSPSTQRRVPSTGTMPSTSPEYTHSFMPGGGVEAAVK
jgi:hypothetical protein